MSVRVKADHRSFTNFKAVKVQFRLLLPNSHRRVSRALVLIEFATTPDCRRQKI